MIYLDSNIFVIAILETKHKGSKALSILKKVSEGDLDASTSYLTWDELFWNVRKLRGTAQALEASRAFLQMPNLRLLEVDRAIVEGAIGLIETYGIAPRDAIHASSAIGVGADILSEDRDFDKIKGLKRSGLD